MFDCHLCSKKFRLKGNLETHVRTVHEKVRPFVCAKCPKTFGQKINLLTHVRNKHERVIAIKKGEKYQIKYYGSFIILRKGTVSWERYIETITNTRG
jgi:hypothetical protein